MDTPESTNQTHPRIALSSLFREFSRRDGLAWQWLALSFVIAAFAIFSRSPTYITHAQFYAEDGVLWFAQAYNYGWLHSLTLPALGYLNTLQRLIAGIALLVPFQWAPLTMVLGGLAWQALPVPILLSRRCRNWGSLPLRLAFAAVYVAIPDAREIHVVCTNSQWHLGVVLGLLSFAAPPEGRAGEIFDVALFLLGSIGGPFGILLLPLLAVFWYLRRQRWTVIIAGLLAAGSVVQMIVFLNHSADRNEGYLGATASLFVRLLGGNSFLGGLLGSHPFGLSLPLACSVCMLVFGIALCVYCARDAGPEIALFFLYCFAIFAAGILSPGLHPDPRGLWVDMVEIPSQRYLFFPSLALLFSIVWCVMFARLRIVRGTAIALMLVLFIGICRDWKIPPLDPVDASKQLRAFEEARRGERVVIPVYPHGWNMTLIKR